MNAIANSLITLGFTLGLATMAPTPNQTEKMPSDQTSEFQRIEQPIETKIAVSIAGLGLIGLELWWFLLSKPDRQA